LLPTLAGFQDAAKHALWIDFYFTVTHPHYPIAIIHQPLSALFILLSLSGMNTTIYFDNQSTGWAVEISDEGADRMLPAEFESAQLPFSQALPQDLLSRRHLLAQLSGARSNVTEALALGHTLLRT
jgi:hypothetical protein